MSSYCFDHVQSADCCGTMYISYCVTTATKNTSDGKTRTAWCSGWLTLTDWHVSGETTRWASSSVSNEHGRGGTKTGEHETRVNIVESLPDDVWYLFTEPRQYDLWENVPCFAALLQAEHHQEGARTKTPFQVSVTTSLSFSSCFIPTATHTFIFIASSLPSIRFLKLPQDNRKPMVDPAESPEYTPPQDQDFVDSSPAHEFSEDHFEVSPDRASPQPPP